MSAVHVTETARAKINLALHVTGRRADGYHLLDSLVTFCDVGDRLEIVGAGQDAFAVSGRFSGDLGDPSDNLVLKARDGLRGHLAGRGIEAGPVSIHLEKNLPVASGIGGGSADAAAALRGLMRLWGPDLAHADCEALALSLGADVPMCLESVPLAARGIGEEITALPQMPAMALVIGNPLIAVSTATIFKGLQRRDNMGVGALPQTAVLADWIDCLVHLRNDLEPAASALVPEIGMIRGMLDAEGALLSRMSGSGATCFGIFDNRASADAAAMRLHAARPDWYFCATTTV